MTTGIRHIKALIICTLALFSQSMAAQSYPVLPTDPAVSRGTLPNGMTYYIVANSTVKGMADIALVQKVGGPDANRFARQCLDSLPLFRDRRPTDFIADQGIRQPRTGFIRTTPDATVYRFRNLPLSSTSPDSLLLLAFDIAKLGSTHDNKTYSPENQAIIIAGNIDKGTILPKLQLLSLLLPHDPAPDTPKRDTIPTGQDAFLTDSPMPDGLTSIGAIFTSGKMPEQYINTVLPLMSKHLWNISTKIIRTRLEKELMLTQIPVGRIQFSTRGEGRYTGIDEYSISLVINDSDTAQTQNILKAVLADLAEGGLSPEEFRMAESSVVSDMQRRESSSFLSNEILTEKCISSFIYGTSIASSKDEAAYLLSSDVKDEVWINILNGFLKGLITPLADKTTDYVLAGKPYAPEIRDTVLFPSFPEKVKISKTRAFNVSGGPVWTFSNGTNVYYKEISNGGDFYYDMTIRSGFGDIKDLKRGEGAFYSDLFFTGSICSIPGHDFKSILEVNGITMNVDVGFSRTRITGRVKYGKMELFMKAMLAVFNGYETDMPAARYYLDCEKIRLTERRGSYADRMASVDSIMCSGYNYSVIKNFDGIHDDLPDRSAKFYNSLFTRSDDGGLILVGKMEEFKLKKLLQQYMGGFRTSNLPRINPTVQYQPSSGWSTYTTGGKATTVDVVTSIQLALNAENYMAGKIVEDFVYEKLADELSGYGLYYSVRSQFSYSPQERFNLSISVEKTDSTGLQATIKQSSFLSTLYSVRQVITKLDGMDISDEKLAAYKNRLKAEYSSEEAKPEYWLSVVSDRIAYGKTFSRFYNEAIDAVTADHIRKILSDLNKGSRVEYIVRH